MRERWMPSDVVALGVRCDVPTAAAILGMGRNEAYKAIQRGTFPVPAFRAGRNIAVPVSALLELLRIEPGGMRRTIKPGKAKTLHVAVYDQAGGLIGIADPADITLVACSSDLQLREWDDDDDERLRELMATPDEGPIT